MKYPSILLILLSFASACGQVSPKVVTVDHMMLKETVAYLSSDSLQGREAGTAKGREAAQWIESQMKEIGLQPWPSTSYQLPFPLNSETNGQNVAGVVKGKGALAEEWVILSAHYDHIGIRTAVDGDSIANGADDNATGVASILSLGKACKAWMQQEQNSRSLMVVAFDAEEMGLMGSKHFVDSVLLQEMDSTQAAVNLNFEMLGKYAEGNKGQAFLTGSERSHLISILQEAGKGQNWKLVDDPYAQFQLYYRSDNASFAKRGIMAHTLSTDPIDQDSLYHSVNDEIESLDLEHTRQVIDGVFHGVKALLTLDSLKK